MTMIKQKFRKRNGFTLVEISIVLVIIGFIAGGILVGRTMIETAESRSVMSQMEKVQTAVTTFKIKYNCIPGDCSSASALSLGTSGNGDGFIGSIGVNDMTFGCLTDSSNTACFTTTSANAGLTPFHIHKGFGEIQYFWAHLSAANLISNQVVILPSTFIDISSAISTYFPKDTLGKAQLTIVPWNSRIYVRTGFNGVADVWSRPMYNQSSINSSQMNYITSKYNYPVVVGTDANLYPTAFTQGQKIIPMGINTSSSTGVELPYLAPTTALPATSFNACVVSDGAGGYKYNVANNGACNFMWEISF